jgi:hypothetical protein
MSTNIHCYHVSTEQGHVYGVAAHGKTEAKVMLQTRLTGEDSTDRPVASVRDFGTWPDVAYGTVLNYR